MVMAVFVLFLHTGLAINLKREPFFGQADSDKKSDNQASQRLSDNPNSSPFPIIVASN